VFLDANVLFSAAYTPESRLLQLWSLGDTGLVTFLFALEEARRNLLTHNRDGIAVLDGLASKMTIVSGTRTGQLPDGVELADKDIPIILAAIDSGCSHLLTGDKRHFDALYGIRIAGVLVQTPAQYLRSRAR
jgi:hypothetical protein